MRRACLSCRTRMFVLACLMLMVLAGCGKQATRAKDDGQDGRAAQYFPMYVGYDARYRVIDSIYDSTGTTRFTIAGTFTMGELAGFLAVDSSAEGMYSEWFVLRGDTVFSLPANSTYGNRQFVVRNRTKVDLAWHQYSVGTPGTPGRYAVFSRQLPNTEMVVLSGGDMYSACGRVDFSAVYEQSGDTVDLGRQYFAPDVGMVSFTWRPDVGRNWWITRELMR